MGLSDRDYVRSSASPAPWSGKGISRRISFLTVNSWLIIICVGVFIADNVLPPRPVPAGVILSMDAAREIRREGQPPSNDPERITRVRFRDGSGALVIAQPYPAVRGEPQRGWAVMEQMRFLESYLYFSTARLIQGIQYWRLIGFQFLHSHDSWQHLIFNMLGLFFFGPLVEQHLGGKRYLAFYLLCGIFGALLYLVLNVLGLLAVQMLGPGVHVPFLLITDIHAPLIGASAGIFGVLIAGAFIAPNEIVQLFFIVPVPLKWVAYGLVALAVFTIFTHGRNAGGEAAHLGGAAAGWWFIRHPRQLHGFFDVLGRADPTSRSGRARRLAGRAGPTPAPAIPGTEAEIDRILDKIRAQGLPSLTAAEREYLARVSRRAKS